MNYVEKAAAIERLTRGPMKDAGITFQPSRQAWRDGQLTGFDIVSESSVAAFVRDVLNRHGFEYTEAEIEAVMPALRLARASVPVNEPVQPIEADPYR